MTLTDRAVTTEGLVEIDGEGFYAIPDLDQIPPFLMSVVSDGDRWMFVSSTGGLTAGRRDSSRALFPYETDDRLHDAAGSVGPVTAFRISTPEGERLWRAFHGRPAAGVTRTLLKSVVGDSVIFEERHRELELSFRYRWQSSDRFGFVRSARLTNDAATPVRVECVDGLLGVLPYGLDPAIYQRMSNLTNAYKRSEILDGSGRLAVFSLESGIADRPEPVEILRATAAWSIGFDDAEVSVSPDTLRDFLTGSDPELVHRTTGRPGAYVLTGTLDLGPGDTSAWRIVADVALDQAAIVSLRRLVESGSAIELERLVEESTARSSRSLVEIMAPADALQWTGDRTATAHHFANVTYNVMRGGVPLSGYDLSGQAFARFARERNRDVAGRHEDVLSALPARLDRASLLERAARKGDPQLQRLAHEYLPFAFARRHGDPSRPWNAFSIRVRSDDGEPILYYEGNWRDIFQNWEALCQSFPEFLPGVISVFVDASTADGFNPYRITNNGIDWEVPDPEDPWSNIGYWGDHQIVYLLRLLEASERFLPGSVTDMLAERRFSYANVPYRLASYPDIQRDPKATIEFDTGAQAEIERRVSELGADGRLVLDEGGDVYLVSLAEKLLVPALSKLSNLVPGGGIWMNTQRPEWNDANNALVGFGLSMVTLFQLRRYLAHLVDTLGASGLDSVDLSSEVLEWATAVGAALSESDPDSTLASDRARKALLDRLGSAFEAYRSRIYKATFSGTSSTSVETLAALCRRAIEHLDATIRINRRPDGLYHSYNLIRFSDDTTEVGVEHLHEMLEGQVAVLESQLLSAEERADLVDALFESDMYRADQDSFTLYPARRLPDFLGKNVIPPGRVSDNPLLEQMLAAGDRSLVIRDDDGTTRFAADFANRSDVEAVLDRLETSSALADLVRTHREATLATYEEVFDHHSYMGRSGSMYGYEGLGSIYWHMVAKLLVGIQGSVVDAVAEGASESTIDRLVGQYRRVRAGLGFNKTASEFGAIPLDPYSHTPAHAGAQQPGMTGLVKEELLTRPLEVGVRVVDGSLRFDPILLDGDELLQDPEAWQLYDVGMQTTTVQLPAGSLGMTFCQVPIVVSVVGTDPSITVTRSDGTTTVIEGRDLGPELSAEVFGRSGVITTIRADIPSRRPPRGP